MSFNQGCPNCACCLVPEQKAWLWPVLVYFLLFLPAGISAQTYFNKVYPLANATGAWAAMPRQSGGYLVWAADLNLGFLIFMVLDEQGDTVSTKLIDISGLGYANYIAWGGG